MVARTIQLILAPVVVVTACAIAVGGFRGHYAVISERVWGLTRERLELLRGDTLRPSAPDHTQARLADIDARLPPLLRRLRLMHDAVLFTYSGMAVLIVNMFVIALAVETRSSLAATLALGSFLLGVTGLLVGVILAILEVRASHTAHHARFHLAARGAFKRGEPGDARP